MANANSSSYSGVRTVGIALLLFGVGILFGRGTSWVDWDLVMRGLKGGNIDPSYCGAVRHLGQQMADKGVQTSRPISTEVPAPDSSPALAPAPATTTPVKSQPELLVATPDTPLRRIPPPMTYSSILDTAPNSPPPAASVVRKPPVKEEPAVSVDLSNSKKARAIEKDKSDPAKPDPAK